MRLPSSLGYSNCRITSSIPDSSVIGRDDIRGDVEGGDVEERGQVRLLASRPSRAWTLERARGILQAAGQRWMGVAGLNISACCQIAVVILRVLGFRGFG